MKRFYFTIVSLVSIQLMAQDSTGLLTISGYTEAYYQFDFNKPSDNNRPGFVYSHNRHNEFNLNLGFIKANYTAERVRANLALAAGTYMNANYAAEPGVMKNMLEANVGIKLSKKRNFWLDAGILPSHIGFESAISKDCWTLTRSILADNSPYFEAGAKLTYTTADGKWLLSGMALNGWQRIKRADGNSLMSWGTQVQFKPSDNVLLNYSTFIGTDKPDSAGLFRLFHNIYGLFRFTDKFGVTAGFDAGSEDKGPGAEDNNTWYAPVVILKYAFNSKWAMAARYEQYIDKNGVIISTGTANGFQTSGFSLNLDHQPGKNVWVRMEARVFNSKDKIFTSGNDLKSTNSFITSSIAVSF